ncbi:hypothetical protein M9194_18185 [Vibrio sp. S4M6]|uniref:hypothetical protein n=1 Tax=Vibrio sinus TaxID=2946865 RepID=UPI00202A5F78|nr:hypothetical protein [Vibrio sinus]MCL9783361.1 hypothetical protein [Vibrio sinus]
MDTVVIFTMQLLTAQCGVAADKHFSDFADFNISKVDIILHQVLPDFVVLEDEINGSGLIWLADERAVMGSEG